MLEAWLSDWRVKVKETKSAQVTFTNRRTDSPRVTINEAQLPVRNEVKYLGLILDKKLTWRSHIINLKLRQMNSLIGRKSKPTTENKLLIYKAILKPIWSYGVQLWGCAKPSNTKIIQRVQSKILRMVLIRKTNYMSVFVFFISLLIVAQHVSGNHVPIIRS